jgi:hypothetical protein
MMSWISSGRRRRERRPSLAPATPAFVISARLSRAARADHCRPLAGKIGLVVAHYRAGPAAWSWSLLLSLASLLRRRHHHNNDDDDAELCKLAPQRSGAQSFCSAATRLRSAAHTLVRAGVAGAHPRDRLARVAEVVLHMKGRAIKIGQAKRGGERADCANGTQASGRLASRLFAQNVSGGTLVFCITIIWWECKVAAGSARPGAGQVKRKRPAPAALKLLGRRASNNTLAWLAGCLAAWRPTGRLAVARQQKPSQPQVFNIFSAQSSFIFLLRFRV